MTILWEALNDAAKPSTMMHFPTTAASGTPLARLLDDAERTAGQIAKTLRPRSAQPRLGLLMANGEPWVRGLFATMRLGAIAVPMSLPTSPSGLDIHVGHLSRIARAADLDTILVDKSVARLAGRVRVVVPEVDLLDITLAPQTTGALGDLRRRDDEIAILQYTSGSTSSPKGVPLTHANVLAGIRTIVAAIEYKEHDRLGSWLPLFHDMGLFSLLTSLLTGASTWLWRPSDFIRNPMAWLDGFARVRATTSPAPNFAYDYLAEAAQEGLPDGLDLSHWRLALNGAEPVRPHTIKAFHEAFAPCGLPPAMMSSCYGLAEATLMVTFSALDKLPGSRHIDRFNVEEGSPIRFVAADDHCAREVVSVGPAAPGMDVRVGPGGDDGVIGEIQIRGTAVTAGYLGLPEQDQPFTADGWLRTADLGFTDAGELFIVGRVKSMIVVRGQNYYAEDIEELVRQAAGPSAVRCAAFHDSELGETMAVLVETPLREPDQVSGLVRRLEEAVKLQLGGQAVRILSVAPRTIPLTTSGKVKRNSLKDIGTALLTDGV